jgi:hypothetical protein
MIDDTHPGDGGGAYSPPAFVVAIDIQYKDDSLPLLGFRPPIYWI